MERYSDDVLMHYGMPRRSGRYPWGSGEDPYQHSGDFLSRVEELKKQGKSESQIAKELGIVGPDGRPSSGRLRAQIAVASDERRSLQVATAKSMREHGYSLKEIADKMGFKNDSSVRALLDPKAEARMNQSRVTANFLRDQVDKKGMVDVGTGVERELGISREKLNQALYILEMDGYPTYGGGVPQVTNKGRQTNLKVLCKPGAEHKDIYAFDKIGSVTDYVTHDGGETFDRFVYPKSMDSKRVQIRYAEDGGELKDGVVELRRGVDDLSLGNSHYAQVRILVNGTHYIKGMAVYSDDLPDGVDVVFNTNKKRGTPMIDTESEKGDKGVLKPIKKDPDNPFGSLIKAGGQSYYIDKDGKRQLSLINKRAEEGDWGDWADKLPSQFLSKQNLSLVKKQLNLAAADKGEEFDEICSLTNPTVKKALLQSFADDCDSAAVHLKAAALPRQKYQVILPLTSINDNEVYAPNYRNGEKVALIRYPHGGTFEIPILTVNNKQPEGIRVLGKTPKDAVGINKKVADRLSGADFDGDTVMVIPTGGRIKITSTHPLKGLEGFDPKAEYGPDTYAGREIKIMKNTQTEMGKISNLITDMTLKGAPPEEIARAVRHSMVVIDAEKHKLNYKQSEIDNNIKALKKEYQGRYDEDGRYREGAGTLISRAKAQTSVPKRQGSPIIDPETGEQSWKIADDLTYVDKKTGKTITRTQKSTQMAETRDARTLSSGHPVEEEYAYYANRMKALANRARKEMLATKDIPYSASAKSAYQYEVDTLKAKLNVALKNAPRERQAQTMANAIVAAKKQDNPDMSKAEIKKASQQALTAARVKTGASRRDSIIELTDREWEAIQAGAISPNMLKQVINNANIDSIKQRAMPRATTALSTAKQNKIAAMRASGYTTSEIAEHLGVSTSTVSKYM